MLEWQRSVGSWQVLEAGAAIDDATCLIKPLAVRALLSAAEADNDAARSLLAKGNELIEQALQRRQDTGHAEAARAASARALLGD